MPSEQLTYEQLAERLGITREAARAIVKRQRLPRSKGNDGKTLVTVDLDELRHKPMSARSPGGEPAVTTTIAALKTRIESLEAELAAEQERSAGHRADFERERDRADRMVTTHDRLVTELENLRMLLEASQQAALPVTPRTWWEMSWPERVRWLRTMG
jgi:hypothetical protein